MQRSELQEAVGGLVNDTSLPEVIHALHEVTLQLCEKVADDTMKTARYETLAKELHELYKHAEIAGL